MNKRIKEMNITRRVNKNVNTYKNVITEDTIDDVCMNIIKKNTLKRRVSEKKIQLIIVELRNRKHTYTLLKI